MKWFPFIVITTLGLWTLCGLKAAWWTFGMTSRGTNVLFPILNVLICPSFFGEIGEEVSTFYGAGLTGM